MAHSADPDPIPRPPQRRPSLPRPDLHISRRGVLLGAAGVVLAAGAGTGAGYLHSLRDEPDTAPPADLLAALESERALIAQIDASITQDPSLRRTLSGIRADHEAHATALGAAIREVTGRAAPPTKNGPARSVSRSGQRDSEQRAATRTAKRAARLEGPNAALLASIAAAEASHAVVLG